MLEAGVQHDEDIQGYYTNLREPSLALWPADGKLMNGRYRKSFPASYHVTEGHDRVCIPGGTSWFGVLPL